MSKLMCTKKKKVTNLNNEQVHTGDYSTVSGAPKIPSLKDYSCILEST